MRVSTLVRCSASFGALALSATPLMAQQTGSTGQPDTIATQPTTAQTIPGQSADQPAQDDAAADAQSAGDEQTIVVTGLRQSLRSQQNIRRNSDQIVDAVVAEDIGKLPDINTAQTAARIPGVQVYRQAGEAQNVLVRGLPNYTTTYNGREIFTAETRVVALQDFPSSNIAALEVFKSSTAELVEPGLAGLVNVRSRRPFDFQDGQFAGTVYGLYTRQGDSFTPNANILLTKRWDTSAGEFGLLLNASYSEMRYLDAEISNTDFIADPVINGQRVRLPDIQRLFYRSGNRSRPSVNAAMQWRPNDHLEIYLEGLWQGFRNRIDDRNLEVPLYGGSSYTNLTLRPGTNLVSGGTVVGIPGSIFSFQGATFNTTDTFQYAGGVRYNRDRFHLTVDVARTSSTFKGSTESLDRRFNGAGTITFDNETPSFAITGINFTDPSGQTFQGLYEENQRSAGRDWQARLDLSYDFDTPLIRNIQLGARYTDRDAQRNFSNRYAFLLPLNINATALPVAFEVFNGVAFQPTYNFTSPVYGSVRDHLVDLRQLIINRCPQILPGDPGNGCRTYTLTPVTAALLYTADEKTYAGYAQLNLGNEDTISGIIGARVLRVETRVAGPVPTGIPIIDEGSERTEFLPNASIRWRLSPEFQFRAAASRTVTRPNFADLQGSITINPQGGGPAVGTDAQPRTGQGGNPFLRPFESWNYDAALEYYFSRNGFASLTLFRRDLDGFIQGSSYRFTDPTLGVVQINGPINSGTGRINGAEFQLQTFFDFGGLPDWLHGFGVQGNVTYLDAKTEQDDGTGTVRLLPIADPFNGVSEWNYNLVGLYERNGFSARLTYNGRSSFLVTRQNRGNDAYFETARPADRLDLSLNWDVMDKATIFFDWTNILRDTFRQDFSSARDGAPRADYVRYLRYDETTFSLGVRFRFGR